MSFPEGPMPLHRLLHARFVSEPRLSWSIRSCARTSATHDHSMSHENWPLGKVSGVSTQRISARGGGDNVAIAARHLTAPRKDPLLPRRGAAPMANVESQADTKMWAITLGARLDYGTGVACASNPRAFRKQLALPSGVLVRFPA